MINLGIIGLGHQTQMYHIPGFIKTGKCTVKAAADPYVDKKVAAELGIPDFYTDYRELLKDDSIDAVTISSPHDLHEEQCVAAFNAGKHVFVEKPISRNLKEAANILESAKKAGKIGMVGFNQRFYSQHVKIKEIIESGKLGKIVSARVDHYQNFNAAPGSWWRSDEACGGGPVIGSGVHRLDLLRWYFGEAVSVYAKCAKIPSRHEAEICAHAVIEFENGAIANFSINWAVPNRLYNEAISITGENGTIFSRDDITKISMVGDPKGVLPDLEINECGNMYNHFVDSIESGKTPICDLYEGYKSLQIVRAIYKSAQTGTVVNPLEIDF